MQFITDVLLMTGARSMRQSDTKRVSRDLTTPSCSTSTASSRTQPACTPHVGSRCSTSTFGSLLPRREPFRPFDPATDYRVYVDGKPRLDGVRDFLASRGVHLAEGSPDDPPQADTVAGLGNRKNELVNKAIEELGVQAYDGSIHFIHRLRQHGFKIAVVTSSQNCSTVLRAVNWMTRSRCKSTVTSSAMSSSLESPLRIPSWRQQSCWT